jgi:hypothetical protein
MAKRAHPVSTDRPVRHLSGRAGLGDHDPRESLTYQVVAYVTHEGVLRIDRLIKTYEGLFTSAPSTARYVITDDGAHATAHNVYDAITSISVPHVRAGRSMTFPTVDAAIAACVLHYDDLMNFR